MREREKVKKLKFFNKYRCRGRFRHGQDFDFANRLTQGGKRERKLSKM
jgi:hypothetical protein